MPKPSGRNAGWGGLARRSASEGGSLADAAKGRLAGAGPSRAAEAFAEAGGAEREAFVPERFERTDRDPDRTLRATARGAVARGSDGTPSGRRSKPDPGLTAELQAVVGATSAPRLAVRLADAGRAYEAERFLDARRILQPLAGRAPASAAVRELLGLTLYRLGRWTEAIKELEAFRSLTGSTEQHPVLADAHRALRHDDLVESLWHELREASPSPELVAEGRIVYAGSLADRGELTRAIAEIEPTVRRMRGAKPYQLRLLYVFGDLLERAGDIPRARVAFDRLLALDPADTLAAERRRSL